MPKIINGKITLPIFAAMLALAVVACASTGAGKGVETEKQLEAAGFKRGVASTPDERARLKKLPQRKVVPYEEGDKVYYIYVDLDKCNCAYAGDEEAYRKYRKLVNEKKLVEEDRRESVRNRQRQMDSDDWNFDKRW